VSEHLSNVTETSSKAMNSEDVKMTSEIIDKLIKFDEKQSKPLEEEV
jgi:hypothetical protein